MIVICRSYLCSITNIQPISLLKNQYTTHISAQEPIIQPICLLKNQYKTHISAQEPIYNPYICARTNMQPIVTWNRNMTHFVTILSRQSITLKYECFIDLVTCYPHPSRIASRYLTFDQSCYEFVSVHKSWQAAEADCRSQGGYLVTIDNSKEQDMVHRVATSLLRQDVWIGLNDINYEARFAWVSGTCFRGNYLASSYIW